MKKMRYKETFVTTWTNLFDPKHTGIITFEKYCQVLGLNPTDKTPLTKTEPVIHPKPDVPTKPSNAEPLRTESIQEEHDSQVHDKSDSQQENSGHEEPKSKNQTTKTLSPNKSKQTKEDSGKSKSRKRKHTESPSKEDLNFGTEKKRSDINKPGIQSVEVADKFDETDTIKPQEYIQATAKNPQSKSDKMKETKSEKPMKPIENVKDQEESEKREKNSVEPDSKDGDGPDDVGFDVFDLLIASNSQLMPEIDIEEEHSLETEPEVENPESITNNESDHLPKPNANKSEKSKRKDINKKRKEKMSGNLEVEPTNQATKHPQTGRTETTMEVEACPIKIADDLMEKPIDEKDSKPEKGSKDHFGNEPERSELKCPDPKSNESIKDLEVATIDRPIEATYRPLEETGLENKNPMPSADSNNVILSSDSTKFPPKKFEGRKNKKSLEKSNSGDPKAEHRSNRERKESRHQPKSEGPDEKASVQKLEKSNSGSSQPERRTESSPIQQATQVKKKEAKEQRVKKTGDSSGREAEKREIPIGVSVMNQPESQSTSNQEQKHESPSFGLKGPCGETEEGPVKDVNIEPSSAAVVSDSTATPHLNPPSIIHEKRNKASPRSKGKRQKMPSNSKSPNSQKIHEHSDVEMTSVKEPLTPSVSEPMDTGLYQLSERPPMEIALIPTQTEIIPKVTEPLNSAKVSRTPIEKQMLDTSNRKEIKERSADHDEKIEANASDQSGMAAEKRGKTGSKADQKDETSAGKSFSSSTSQQLPSDEINIADEKSNRSKKPPDLPPGQEEPLPPIESDIVSSITATQESATPLVMSGTNAEKMEVEEPPLPATEQADPPKTDPKRKQKKKSPRSSPSKMAKGRASAKTSGQEQEVSSVKPHFDKPGDFKQKSENEPLKTSRSDEAEVESSPKSILETSVTQIQKQETAKASGSHTLSESSLVEGDTSDHKEDKKNHRPSKASKTTKNKGTKAPGSHSQKRMDENTALAASTDQESSVGKTSNDGSQKAQKTKETHLKGSKQKDPSDEQTEAAKTGGKKAAKLDKRPAKPAEKVPEKVEASAIKEVIEKGGLEISNDPVTEAGSAKKSIDTDPK